MIAHAPGGKVDAQQEAGATRPQGTRRTTRRPLALPRQRTAAAAEARTPASSPHRLTALCGNADGCGWSQNLQIAACYTSSGENAVPGILALG